MTRNVYFKLWVNERYRCKGGYTIWLVIRKGTKRKTVATGLYAEQHQWDDAAQRYLVDKRTAGLHKDRAALNLWLDKKRTEIERINDDFERNRIDWTVSQFETALLNYTAKGKIEEYLLKLIDELTDTGHHGNANCYSALLRTLRLFDKKLSDRQFCEVDIKYVKSLDRFMQKRDNSGNTRKYYFKALRACYNKAIQDGEAKAST